MVQCSHPLKTVLVISMCQSIVHVCAALLVEEFLPMMIHQPEEARAASSRSKQQQQQAAGREWEYMCADTHNKQQQHSFVLFSHIELTVIGWMLVTNHRLNQGLEGKHPNVTFPPIPRVLAFSTINLFRHNNSKRSNTLLLVGRSQSRLPVVGKQRKKSFHYGWWQFQSDNKCRRRCSRLSRNLCKSSVDNRV